MRNTHETNISEPQTINAGGQARLAAGQPNTAQKTAECSEAARIPTNDGDTSNTWRPIGAIQCRVRETPAGSSRW